MEAIKKENIYLDLSKLSGEEIKEVGQILKDAEEPVYENTAYDLSLGYKDRLYILLSFGVDNWLRYNEIDNKTEITLSEFRQLFSKGEEVLQVENNENKLNEDLIKLVQKFKNLETDYKNREENDKKLGTEFLYNKSRKEAYSYSAKELENLLHWHSVIDLSEPKF